MEKLDFSGLLACYSDKRKTMYHPVCCGTYANMRGVRAVDRIVELCERDLAFTWLTKRQKPRGDAFYDFKDKKLTVEVLDERNINKYHRFIKHEIEKYEGKKEQKTA